MIPPRMYTEADVDDLHRDIAVLREAIEEIVGEYVHHSSGLWCTRTAGGGVVYLSSQASMALDKALKALVGLRRA